MKVGTKVVMTEQMMGMTFNDELTEGEDSYDLDPVWECCSCIAGKTLWIAMSLRLILIRVTTLGSSSLTKITNQKSAATSSGLSLNGRIRSSSNAPHEPRRDSGVALNGVVGHSEDNS